MEGGAHRADGGVWYDDKEYIVTGYTLLHEQPDQAQSGWVVGVLQLNVKRRMTDEETRAQNRRDAAEALGVKPR